MANNDIIRHSDIAEDNLMQPLRSEIALTVQELNKLDSELIKMATDLKKSLGTNALSTSEDINKFSQQVEYSTEVLKQSITVKNNIVKTEAALVIAVSESTQELVENNLAVEQAKKLAKDNAKLTSDQVGAYDKLAITLNRSKKEYKDLFILQKEGSIRAKELKSAIDSMEVSIRAADAQVHQHQRNVGNYGHSFNGLSNSVNQLTREMPAFANSAQTGFMAISNNLPILADAINDLKAKNAALNAEGKAGVPIWKSVAGALFSWQTAMGVGITLLTVYGAEIAKAIGSLFQAEDATQKLKDAQDELNQSLKEGLQSEKNMNDYIAMTLDSETKINLIKAKKRGASQRELAEIEEKGIATRIRVAIDQEIRAFDIVAGVRAKASRMEVEQLTKISEEEYKKLVEDNNKRIEEAQAYATQIADIRVKIENGAGIARQQAKADILEDDKKTASERKKIADDLAKKREQEWLKELELQHQVNVAQIMTYEDTNVRKIAIIQENLLYEQAVNETKIKDAKRLAAIQVSLAKQADNEIKSLIANKTTAEQVDPINQNPDLLKKALKFSQDKRKKEEDSELKAKQSLINKSIQLVQSSLDKENAMKMKAIDADIQASQRREDQLRAIASKGAQSTQDNLAFELRKQAELEAKKDKQIKKQIQQERALAILKAFSSGNITDAKSLSGLIPSFKDGTENTGRVGDPLDADGGRLAILHNEERVFTKEQNKKIGTISNEAAANILSNFNMLNATSFDRIPMSNHVNDDRHINKLDEVAGKIDELTNTIKNRPIARNEFDEVEKLTRYVVTEGLKTTITSKKVGGLYRG